MYNRNRTGRKSCFVPYLAENGCLAVDIYTCGDKNPKIIAIKILEYLNSLDYYLREVNR